MQHKHKEDEGLPLKTKPEEKTITCLQYSKNFLFHLFKCVCFQKFDL